MDDILDLDCGIATRRIVHWLDDELALPRSEHGWTFSEDRHSCTVEVEPLESRKFSTLELERTHLIAHGNPKAVAAFNKLFTLRFISAGG